MSTELPVAHEKKRSGWLFSPLLLSAACIIFLVVLFRVPSFTEPYWYGDEAIYLTIGNAMNQGDVLYQDIVDHKTPLIYYFARVGSQLSFRLLMTVWMIGASLAFLGCIHVLTRKIWLSAVTTIGFVILTSIPFLEGNIPNGELFVMGFVLVGLWVFLRTKAGGQMASAPADKRAALTAPNRVDLLWWFVAGGCMGGAILTKAPALFDALALLFIGWLAGWDQQLAGGGRWQWQWWRPSLLQWVVVLSGIVLPIVLSVGYFFAIGAGDDYLRFGLLYNFHYVQNWALGHLPGWQQQLFTLPNKAPVLAVLLFGLTFLGRWVTRPVRFAFGWFYLALFAAILSNRPYPHYLLQVVPPLLLSVGLILQTITSKKLLSHNLLRRLLPLGLLLMNLLLLGFVWNSLKVSHYPVVSYYQSYLRLAAGQTTPVEYSNAFNSYLADNYAAASILKTSTDDAMFIWGTNPTLYALTGKQPVGRFTVGFHIQDLNLYQETIETVQQEMPQYIIVMHDEPVELPGLKVLLAERYMQYKKYEHFTIWRRRLLSSSYLQSPGK